VPNGHLSRPVVAVIHSSGQSKNNKAMGVEKNSEVNSCLGFWAPALAPGPVCAYLSTLCMRKRTHFGMKPTCWKIFSESSNARGLSQFIGFLSSVCLSFFWCFKLSLNIFTFSPNSVFSLPSFYCIIFEAYSLLDCYNLWTAEEEGRKKNNILSIINHQYILLS